MATDASPGHVLIVDDIPENIDILGRLLSDYRRTVALNGPAALAIAKGAEPPDLILLDVMMPGMDGHQVCQALKADERLRSIPVIFVTAMGDAADEARGFAVGAVDYITKPFKAQLVRARVQTHLALRMAQRRLAERSETLEEAVTARTRELQRALADVQRASLDTIVKLSKAAEYKDEDTGAHVARMSQYCAAIAQRLGQSQDEVANLLHAAPMHDIGKIGIPDRILLKPSTLDAAEWAVMRTHAEIGARILAGSDSEVIRLGEVIALTHHEKWDGTGYPRGLHKQEIPLAGRIAAVADVFDALTSKRPYKKAFTIERSFDILREGRGSHFDPAVTDAFFAVESEILAIRARNQEAEPSPFSGFPGTARVDSPVPPT